MPIELATNNKAPAVAERTPGDFKRHATTGAPYVTHPTDTKKRAGTKAELTAACDAAGIDPAAVAAERGVRVTNALMAELLGPEPKLVMYGRPSSLGKQIENTTNLQKWAERAVALGVYLDPSIVAQLATLPADTLNLDDDQARTLLDEAAVRAKNTAQAGLAAERGTHSHELTEDHDEERDWIDRAKAGEDLGIPHEAQAALVAAWEQMLEHNGLEILATEARVVDDEWRQAGSLDRIAYLTRDLRFTLPTGEIVTLEAGTVIVLDIKTGKLRSDRGIVQYWLGYSVQVASYAKAKPYDPDTGLRSEWPWPVNQRWAVIAHLDVLAAIDGEAKCRLVLVDLEAGREAGERCVWARQWEKRTDVFSIVDGPDETTVTVPVERGDAPAVSDLDDDFDAPVTAPDPAATLPAAAVPTTEDAPVVVEPDGAGETSAVSPAPENDAVPDEADERAEMRRHDDNGHLGYADPADLAQLVETVKQSPHKGTINAWLAEACAADRGWNPRVKGTVRRYEILRAAHHLSEFVAAREDDAGVRVLLTAVLDTDQPEQTGTTVGAWLGELSTDEARLLADMAKAGAESTDLAAPAA